MMAIMSQLFGAVAGGYDEVRPGYPSQIVAAVRAYHGGVPGALVEVGAGTGLATRTLLGADGLPGSVRRRVDHPGEFGRQRVRVLDR